LNPFIEKMKKIIPSLVIIAILASCSTIKMNTFQDEDFDISTYQSFDFYKMDLIGVNKELEKDDMSQQEFNTRVG
jgi:hypothetical protein